MAKKKRKNKENELNVRNRLFRNKITLKGIIITLNGR